MPKARENAGDQNVFSVSFTSDRLSGASFNFWTNPNAR